jgi:hypothetical protein
VKVEGTSLLYAHSPKGGELSVLPLEALTKGFQVVLTDLGILRVFVRIGKGYGDEPPVERPEGSTVDACQASQEVPAAQPGESFYLAPDTLAMLPTGIDLAAGSVIVAEDTGERTSYSRGEVSTSFLRTVQEGVI